MFGSYEIPNQRADAYDVVVNKPKVSAYRAPGSPQGTFAMESLMDELAERLDMDHMELRLKNAAREGVRRTDGVAHSRIGAEEVMRAAQETPHYRSELTGQNRGRGISMGYWGNAGLESSAFAALSSDGEVSLVLGSVDIGGQRAALAMQLAEALGIAYEDVHPRVVDTDSIGFTHVTGGSRTTFATGWAVYESALDIRRQLEERAAQIWDVDREQVSYGADAVIRGPTDDEGSERALTFKELCAQLPRTGGLIQGHADVLPTGVGAAFGCHIVDVEVDPETGKVEILRYTAVQDVGKAIHPSYVEGQIQGGVAQGAGMALTEEYFYGEVRDAVEHLHVVDGDAGAATVLGDGQRLLEVGHVEDRDALVVALVVVGVVEPPARLERPAGVAEGAVPVDRAERDDRGGVGDVEDQQPGLQRVEEGDAAAPAVDHVQVVDAVEHRLHAR